MNTAQRLGLVLLYVVMAGNAALMLSIFIQILFRAVLERDRRPRNGGATNTLGRSHGKRGWANSWLPRNPVINHPAPGDTSTGKPGGVAPIVKRAIALVSIVIAIGLPWSVAAQLRAGSEVSDSTLKQQLLDLELKEMRIRMRLEELNQQLKPESIERELAGIGSTRPEELREHRRKLLTIEQNGLQTQLDLLEEDLARIEAAIAAAGTAANLEYAQPAPSPLQVTTPTKPITEMSSLRYFEIAEVSLQRLSVAVAMLVLLGSGFILTLIVSTQKVQQLLAAKKSASSRFQTNRKLS